MAGYFNVVMYIIICRFLVNVKYIPQGLYQAIKYKITCCKAKTKSINKSRITLAMIS